MAAQKTAKNKMLLMKGNEALAEAAVQRAAVSMQAIP